jgi:enoyl-CoA hydratase
MTALPDRLDADAVTLDTIILHRVADGVVLITLNRPEQANGVVAAMADELLAALAMLERDLSVRALVLTGAGRQFCAGADLPALKAHLDERRRGDEEEPYAARVLLPVTQRVVACRLPVIAAINGGATAGGLDLAMACDIRLASTRAKLGETYVKVGLAAGGNGGAWFLPRLVGSGMAAELALTGDIVDAERALAIGLVNRVCEPDRLIPDAVALAARIAAHPWRAVEASKRALHASWHTDLATALSSSYYVTATLQQTADFREGIEAALEKRTPHFNRIGNKKA